MEIHSPTLDLTDFEDPINMEPFTNVVRCPHDPSHYYQFGTLLRKLDKGVEYTQCSLTNQWFVSTEFRRDTFATKASNRILEINQLFIAEKEKTKVLENQVQDLTAQVGFLIKENETYVQALNEQKDLNKKTIEELKSIIITQDINHQKQLDKYREDFQKMKENHIAEMEQYRKLIEKQNRDFEELKDEHKKLLTAIPLNDRELFNSKDFLIKIAISIVGITTVTWAYRNLIPKIKGLL